MRRRIEELRGAGLLYFDIDVDDAVLGVNANVMLWLKVEPACLDAAGRAVAAHPEIPFAAATTGPTNLAVSAIFRDTRQLYAYLTTRLAGPARPAVRGDRADHRHDQADRPNRARAIIEQGPFAIDRPCRR